LCTNAELGQTNPWSKRHRLVGTKTDRKGDSREDMEREKSSGELPPCHLEQLRSPQEKDLSTVQEGGCKRL